jgi:hypothetical protein
MKGSETFIALLRGVPEIFQYACLAVGCISYQDMHGLTTGILKDDWGYNRSTLEARFPDATAVYGKLRIELTVKRLRRMATSCGTHSSAWAARTMIRTLWTIRNTRNTRNTRTWKASFNF